VSASDGDGVKFVMDDESWLLIRPSGTEPVLRVYAEAPNPQQVDLLLDAGVRLADNRIRQMQAAY
jgi:phosphomannomutase